MKKIFRVKNTSYLLLIVVLFFGCAPSDSNKKSFIELEVEADGFDVAVSKLFACQDDYEANDRWYYIKKSINFENPSEVKKWLKLQKKILELSKNGSYIAQSIDSQAIQEFSHYIEHVPPYEEWLKSCLEEDAFKDPFINKRIKMTLNSLEIYKERMQVKE